MTVAAFARVRRLLAGVSVGALVGIGLAVVPTTTIQAEVVHHTKAGEVAGALERSEVRRLPFPTRHAALYWAGHPDAEVTVAFSRDGANFDAAMPVEHDEVGMQRNNGQTYGTILPAGDATFVLVTTDRPLGRLTVLALAANGTSIRQTPVPAKPARAAVTVLPRSGWGADESLRFNGTTPVWPPVFQTVQKVAVHHTAGANGESGPAAQATIQSIYYYHAITQGWGDIGYNFLIDAGGVVYKGRSTSATMADADTTGENAAAQGVTAGHAYGYNSGSVGIALLGNFVNFPASGAADSALKDLLISKASAHGLNAALKSRYTSPLNGSLSVEFENVPGHQEVPDNATECPGGVFLKRLFDLRSEVAAAATTPDTKAPTNASALTATVSKRSVKLVWDTRYVVDSGSGGGTSGVVGYDVWRLSGGRSTRVGGTIGSTFTDTVSGPKAAHSYTVKTFDGAGNRSAGVTVKVTA